MENTIFIRIEILIFILSLLYILYYFGSKTYAIYFNVKNRVKPEKIKKRKTALNKVNVKNKNINKNKKSNSDFNVSNENKQKVFDIMQKVKLNVTKGYFDTARSLIVEGLSIDKYNRDLNLSLALIYEKEKSYLNAEYIYKDLLDNYNGDYEIMKNLGYVLALQDKLVESLLIYELLHTKNKGDNEVLEILSDLNFTLKDYKKTLKYVTLYLSSKPRDLEKLAVKAFCLDQLGNIDEAIDIYEKILELQPYNTKAKDNLLLMEEKKKEIEK